VSHHKQKKIQWKALNRLDQAKRRISEIEDKVKEILHSDNIKGKI
jgi:hypothetical protein